MVDAGAHAKVALTPKLLGAGLLAATCTAALCLLARQQQWTLGWIYVGLMVVILGINLACLLRWNPVLIGRRIGMRAGTKTWDIALSLLFAPALVAVFVVPAFEVRDAAPAPGLAWLLGMAVLVPSWALVTRAMVVNPFFEKSVRIQTEHAHRVIDSGPYAVVRHPGYVGIAGWLLVTPVLLDSDWALIPALLSVLWLVIRTALEDRTLQAELPGYVDYAARVRFRLIPWLW